MAPARGGARHVNEAILQSLRQRNLPTTYQGRCFSDWTIPELHGELELIAPERMAGRFQRKLHYVEAILDIETGSTEIAENASDTIVTSGEEPIEARFTTPLGEPLQVLRRAQSVPHHRLRLILRPPTAATPSDGRSADTSEIELPTCQVCYERLPEGDSNEVPADATCMHTKSTVCTSCMQTHIQVLSASHALDEIPCPEHGCTTVLAYSQMRASAPAEIFDRFDKSLNQKALAAMEGFLACSNTACSQSGLYDAGSSYIICVCGTNTCVTCHTAWHPGLSHEENIEEIQRAEARKEADRLHGKDEEKSAKYLKNRTKACPKCGQPIVKNLGCNHMTCKSRSGKNGKHKYHPVNAQNSDVS